VVAAVGAAHVLSYHLGNGLHPAAASAAAAAAGDVAPATGHRCQQRCINNG
jgi:hypothetical protein